MDFHTAGADYPSTQRIKNAEGKPLSNPIVTRRTYLSDAAFTVVLTGPEDLIGEIDEALRNPVWSVSLGRRSCPPVEPFLLGRTSTTPDEILKQHLPVYRSSSAKRGVRLIRESVTGTTLSARDAPTDALCDWSKYHVRRISVELVDLPDDMFVDDPFDLVKKMRDLS